MTNTVISLCDRTGNMVRPWIDAGYRAILVDLQKGELWDDPRCVSLVIDVRKLTNSIIREWMAGEPAMIFAFPPCTHLAVSGARWFKEKGMGKLIEALQIVEACRNICESAHSRSPWMLENPVGTLATYWREPDYFFDPCDYGDPYTKKTCLWTGNGFVMPEKINPGDMFAEPTRVEPTLGSMIHKMAPSADRGDLRSITPKGFARAVFQANAPHLQTIAAE